MIGDKAFKSKDIHSASFSGLLGQEEASCAVKLKSFDLAFGTKKTEGSIEIGNLTLFGKVKNLTVTYKFSISSLTDEEIALFLNYFFFLSIVVRY